MKKTTLADGIFLVRFPTQYELASTFLRFQEHAESVRFAGGVFTLEQYMDWYAAEFGNFTYFEDWAGFNVPSTALEAFYAGRFDPLSEKEKRFLRQFRNQRRPFYVIGVADSSSRDDLTHELAHAIFFTDPEYRAAVLRELRGYNTKPVERALNKMGYTRSVLRDEVHAYLIAGDRGISAAKAAHLKPLKRKLRSLFRRYRASLIGKRPH